MTEIRNAYAKCPIDLTLLRDWLKQAGQIAMAARQQLRTEQKPDGTPVTTADFAVEAFLVDKITMHYPGHQIITEETGIHTGDREFVWIIDPIDGTRVFASGLPVWGISVGIFHRSMPHSGAFYMPAVQEMYWASEAGAYCNGQPLARHVSDSIDGSVAFLAVPSKAHHLYDIDFPRIRSLGSTTAHLVYVARGPAVGALTRQIGIWDIAGVLPLLLQTGCSLVYLSGKPVDLPELLNGELSPEPILVAHQKHLEKLCAGIRKREGG